MHDFIRSPIPDPPDFLAASAVMRRQGNHPTRPTRQSVALIAVLLLAAAFACFLLLNSATSTTTSAQTPTYTKYKAVDTGQTYTCSIKEAKDAQGNPTTDDGKIDCWGHTGTGFTAPPDDGRVRTAQRRASPRLWHQKRRHYKMLGLCNSRGILTPPTISTPTT